MNDFILSESASGRIKVLPRPVTAPGHCVVCGHTGTNETGDSQEVLFFDFQFDIDYYGRVYFCTQCMVEMMGTLGFITPTEAEALRNKTAEQESELIILRDQNERLRNSLVSLLGGVDDSVLGDTLVLVSPAGEVGQDVFVEARDGSGSSTEDEQPSDKPARKQRSARVSDDSSGDEPGLII